MSDIQQCQLCGADLVAGGSDINAELAKRDADIERLRNALEDCQNLDEAPDLRAEIERLRASERSAWNAAVQRDAEIERLRAALVADDGGRMAYQNGWDNREPEIERLRGLLRYAVPSGDAPKDWYKRVREALGE